MRERHPSVGLVTGEEEAATAGRKEKKQHIFEPKTEFVLGERESNTHGVYHLLLQLVVFPVDQNHSFLENWGEKTQQRLSLECECLLGGCWLDESKCFGCDSKPLRIKQLQLQKQLTDIKPLSNQTCATYKCMYAN